MHTHTSVYVFVGVCGSHNSLCTHVCVLSTCHVAHGTTCSSAAQNTPGNVTNCLKQTYKKNAFFRPQIDDLTKYFTA